MGVEIKSLALQHGFQPCWFLRYLSNRLGGFPKNPNRAWQSSFAPYGRFGRFVNLSYGWFWLNVMFVVFDCVCCVYLGFVFPGSTFNPSLDPLRFLCAWSYRTDGIDITRARFCPDAWKFNRSSMEEVDFSNMLVWQKLGVAGPTPNLYLGKKANS